MADPLAPISPISGYPAFGESDPSKSGVELKKAELSYRAELLKMLSELAKHEEEYRAGIMDGWSAERIAFEGSRVRILNAVIGAEPEFAMANATVMLGKSQFLKLAQDRWDMAYSTIFGQPDAKAIEHFNKNLGGAAFNVAGGALSSDDWVDRLDAATVGDDEAFYSQFRAEMDQQVQNSRVLDSLKTDVGDIVDPATKASTARAARTAMAMNLQNRIGTDPRVMRTGALERYLAETEGDFAAHAGLDASVLKGASDTLNQAQAAHDYLQAEADKIASAYGFSQKTRERISNELAILKDALSGKPEALGELSQAIPTPKSYQDARARLEGELGRMDMESRPQMSARNQLIRAFNDRAGEATAFIAWANAMGFSGPRALDRAALFAAEYPDMGREWTDMVRADKTLLDATGGFQKAKDALREKGRPVGTAGLYRAFTRATISTPAETMAGIEDSVKAAEVRPEEGSVEPAVTPIQPRITPVASHAESDGKRDIPQTMATRVEMAPDGLTMLIRHPDGTVTVTDSPDPSLMGRRLKADDPAIAAMGQPIEWQPMPTDLQAQSVPAGATQPRVLDLGEEYITPMNSRIASSVGAAPSDIPGSGDIAPDMASIVAKRKMEELKARMAQQQKLDAMYQQIQQPLAGQLPR